MENSSLKVLWDHATRDLNPSQDTAEHKAAHENYCTALKDLEKFDRERAGAIEEASNDLSYHETYQAFVLGFREAVGLLMGCSK